MITQAIKPLKQKPSRKERRGYVREYYKIEPYIEDLETKFELAIFKAPEHLTYADLYEFFHDKWQDLVKKLMLQFDLRYSVIDIHHFAKQYRPYWRNLKK